MADWSLRATVSTIPTGLGRLLLAGVVTVALPLAAAAQSITPTPIPGKSAPAAAPSAPAAAPKAAAPKPTAKPAAEAPKAAKAPTVATEDDPLPWVKVCSKDAEKKNVCLVAKELRSQEGRLVASVALRDIEGDPKKVLLIAVPPPVLIQPGMRVGVDKAKPEEAKFTICFPNACYAEMPVSDQLMADMKKGKALVVVALDVQQKAEGFPFSLGNPTATGSFKMASEGPGIDPAANQESQDQLQQALQKKAEDAAKKLEGGAPAATPATPAAPKP